MPNRAILLTNLGSPDQPSTSSVRAYLNQFLMDPYVIQLPWIIRRLIVSLLVLPTRPKKSALAYQSVWTDQGSPLISLSKTLASQLQDTLPIPVKLAMRYGNPSIESALLEFEQEGIDEVLLIPLYPHFADSTVTTSIKEAERVVTSESLKLSLSTLPVFYNKNEYIQALVASAKPWISAEENFDHVLFSYHGLPVSHIKKAAPEDSHTADYPDCCNESSHAKCYRHQVFKTTQLFINASKLNPERCSIAFQSRLGRDKWLEPSTEDTVRKLAQQGVKKLVVICPAFVTDCLETLEEIEMEAGEIFKLSGGESLTLIPCLNNHPEWVKVLSSWCQHFNEGI